MADFNLIKQLALDSGFSHVGELDVDTIELKPEVRAMCNADKCNSYDKNWSCPPACGTLEECGQKIHKYKKGILLQTTGEVDTMDYEEIVELSEAHQKHYGLFSKQLKKLCPEAMIIGDGTCKKCKTCTYPDQPCRFPNELTHSMEGLGMLVSEVCQKNNLPYYYGRGTLTYVGCVLYE